MRYDLLECRDCRYSWNRPETSEARRCPRCKSMDTAVLPMVLAPPSSAGKNAAIGVGATLFSFVGLIFLCSGGCGMFSCSGPSNRGQPPSLEIANSDERKEKKEERKEEADPPKEEPREERPQERQEPPPEVKKELETRAKAEDDRDSAHKAKLAKAKGEVASARAKIEEQKTTALHARAALDSMLREKGLSDSEAGYVRANPLADLSRIQSERPMLNADEPIKDGSLGTPFFTSRVGIARKTTSVMSITRIVSDDELAVLGGKLWVKGIKTAGLKKGDSVDLGRLFVADGARVFTEESGKTKRTIPYLATFDVKKVGAALAHSATKDWVESEEQLKNAQLSFSLASLTVSKIESDHERELTERSARGDELRDDKGRLILDRDGNPIRVIKSRDGKTVFVRAYYTKDGKYVAAHTRSAPGSGTSKSGGGRRGGGRGR